MFSDESCFCLDANGSHMLVRRRLGERFAVCGIDTGHTPGVMVQGSISYYIRSTLDVIPITLTANFLRKIRD